jgi:hypothetical protein
MNSKKVIFRMMVVALVAAISVGFTSCSDDDDDENNKGFVSSNFIMRKWYRPNYGNPIEYEIEFKTDGTYIFEHPILGRTEGNYRIIETSKSEILGYDATLFKMLVSGNSGFDQFWVYYIVVSIDGQIVLEIYSNNELVDDVWTYSHSDDY